MTRHRGDRPPASWLAIARSVVRADRRDEVEGDLLELWKGRLAGGRGRARLGFWRDVASLALRHRAAKPLRRLAPSRGLGIGSVLQDIRYALRLARRQPAFSALAIITLALGIAASTAIFTIADRVLLRPLPYAKPDRIVAFATTGRGAIEFSEHLTTLPQFAAIATHAAGGLNLGDEASAVRVRAAAVSSAFFDVLGARPVLGRVYDATDADDARVAVVSFEAWRRYFGSDRALVGTSIRLNSQAYAVIGVMPRGFRFPDRSEVWVPPGVDRDIRMTGRRPTVIARLAPGVSATHASHVLTAIKQARERTYDAEAVVQAVIVTSLHDDLVGAVRPTVLFLAALVSLLLAITCANVAGLLLSRLRLRERELLVRKALGATRSRLVRQLVTECLVMAAAGAALGLALAVWAVGLVASAVPAVASDVQLASADARFFATGALVSTLAAVIFSLGPALAASRRPAAEMMRDVSTGSGRRRWFGSGLVIGQVAAAVILLAAASAALVTVARLMRVELGFNNEGAVVFEITLPAARYQTPAAIAAFLEQAEQRFAAIPGVRHVGATSLAPGGTGLAAATTLRLADGADAAESTTRDGAGRRPPPPRGPVAPLLAASPGYFDAMGIPVLAGRAFTPRDAAGSSPVVILSETAAKALGDDLHALIGRHFALVAGRPRPAEIVGIVGDIRLTGIGDPSRVMGLVFQPAAQNVPRGALSFSVAARGDAPAVAAAIRAALRDIDPELPIYNITRVEDLHARFLVTERLTLGLTAAFSGLALLLCAIGLYGVLAQTVSQRTREIGIRMALGADRGGLRRSVVGQGLAMAAAGVAIGALTAGLAARAASSVMPMLDEPGALIIVADALVLLLVAALAAWIPARRASAVDPALALRAD